MSSDADGFVDALYRLDITQWTDDQILRLEHALRHALEGIETGQPLDPTKRLTMEQRLQGEEPTHG